jgi:hypothetical protein
MDARKVTAEEQAQGYAICGCESFAFVWSAGLLRWLPPGYHGELCPECQSWTCSVEKLKAAEEARRRGEFPERRLQDVSQTESNRP